MCFSSFKNKGKCSIFFLTIRIDKCTGLDIEHRHQASDIGTYETGWLGGLVEIMDHVSGPPEMRVLKPVYK